MTDNPIALSPPVAGADYVNRPKGERCLWVRLSKKDGRQLNGVIPTTNLLKIRDCLTGGVIRVERRNPQMGAPVVETYLRDELARIEVLGVIGHGAEAFIPGKRKPASSAEVGR